MSIYNAPIESDEFPILGWFYERFNKLCSTEHLCNFKNKIDKDIRFNLKLIDFLNERYKLISRKGDTYQYYYLFEVKDGLYIKLSQSSYNKNVWVKFYFKIEYYNIVSEIKTELLNNKSLRFRERRVKDVENLYCVIKTASGYELIRTDKKTKKTDINSNYNDNVVNEYNRILVHLKDKENVDRGLIMLSGEPGTGKTRLIKEISKQIEKEFIIIPPTLIPSLSTPEFISFLIKKRGSILVFEDADDFLIKRGSGNANSAGVSSLLNISGGIYTDFLDIKIICTFNTDMKNIDEALLRKGRLFSSVEFNKLTLDKTNKLLKKLGVDYISDKEMTLADIYNLKDISYNNTETKKIGFR